MTYPQPDSNLVVANSIGSNIFRFSTLLASPGDIYESQQSGFGFAIGPDSDVANVTLAYLDPAVMPPAPTNLVTAQVSAERAFTGFVAARNDTAYIPAGYDGRVLFFSSDLYNPSYVPREASLTDDRIVRIVPRLDLIEYLLEAPSVTPARSDKRYLFSKFENGPGGEADGKVFVILPFYGRAYASITCTSRDGEVELDVKGIVYATNEETGVGTEVDIGDATIAENTTATILCNAQTNGMFDALLLQLEPTADMSTISLNLSVVMSDLAK